MASARELYEDWKASGDTQREVADRAAWIDTVTADIQDDLAGRWPFGVQMVMEMGD